MKPRYLLVSTLLLIGIAIVPRPAHAGAPTADDLIKEGVEHRRQGDDASALASFERAYALMPTAHALAQEALAEQALGRWAEADDHLRNALADRSDPWIAKNRASLEDSLATIDKHVGRLEILGGLAGAEVRVNGRLAGTLPLGGPISVEVGSATLGIHLAGYVAVERTVAIVPQMLTRETIALVAEAMAPPPAPPALQTTGAPAAAQSGWKRWRVMTAFGVGVLGLATGVIAEIVRSNDFSDFENGAACGAGLANYGSPSCRSSHDGAELAQDFVIVGFAVAVVASGLGTYWLATGGGDHAGLALTPPRISCAAAPGGSGGRIECALHF
jgi:hypothetical protein